jgi:hypothetical protein
MARASDAAGPRATPSAMALEPFDGVIEELIASAPAHVFARTGLIRNS